LNISKISTWEDFLFKAKKWVFLLLSNLGMFIFIPDLVLSELHFMNYKHSGTAFQTKLSWH